MKTLFIDCGMGAAGDMLTAALLELLPDSDVFVEKLNNLGLPGVHIAKEASVKCGITGTYVRVSVYGEEEESCDYHHDHHHDYHHDHGHSHEHHHRHDYEHEHSHGHSHNHDHDHDEGHHHHNSLNDIEHLVRNHLPVSEKVKDDVMAVYQLIGEAESKAHGVPISEIHFHEVGSLDAVADITAVCMLMEEIAPEQVIVSPIHVGSGQVKCAHGILPVPAPATAHILRDVPIYGGRIWGELCTPTGAALLKHFATDFGEMPVMKVKKIGYGMGKKDFEAANCVRVLLGDSLQKPESIIELACNLDDMTPEVIGFVMEVLFEAGALEVYTIPIGMKKSRPGIILNVMCRESDREKILELIFKHTSTLGIREQISNRYTLKRSTEILDTSFGKVRKKISKGYGVEKEKYEYEDLARIAKEEGLSIAQVISCLKIEELEK